MNKIGIDTLPGSLKKLALVFADTIEVFECAGMNEILDVNEKEPLELTVINQTKEGRVERHFFIGVALDLDYMKPANEKNPPKMYFSEMNDLQYDKYIEMVNRKLLNNPDPYLLRKGQF